MRSAGGWPTRARAFAFTALVTENTCFRFRDFFAAAIAASIAQFFALGVKAQARIQLGKKGAQ
jgi:hypothetical protein